MSNFELDPSFQESKTRIPPPYYTGQIIDNATGEVYMPPGSRITAVAVDMPDRSSTEELDLLIKKFPPTIVIDENWTPVTDPR